MHDVQTPSFLGVLPTIARTVWMLGFQRRRVRRWEWLTDMPKPGPLPQTSQIADTELSSYNRTGGPGTPPGGVAKGSRRANLGAW